MEKKTKGALAVTAGLAAVVALSPIALPLASAYAEEGSAAADSVSAQGAGTPEDKSALGWHHGSWDNSHLYVDLVFPWGLCDRCGAPYWDGFGPGCGDDQEPEQQQGFITFQCTDPKTGASTMQDAEGPIVENKMTISEVPGPYIVIEAGYKPSKSEPVVETHMVTFDDQIAETENVVVEVNDGDSVDEPTVDPTCEGYSFEGWYTEPECLTPYDFTSAVTSDITLYAKWVEDGGSTVGPDTPPENPDADQGDSSADQENPGADHEGPDSGTQATDVTPGDDASSEGDALPETGDATVAVSGIAALGVTTAGLGVLLRRRR